MSWERYRSELHAFVSRRVGNDADAEDIVQDVFVRALDHRNALRDRDKLRSWLFRITRNAIIDHYRARRPSEPLPPDLVAEDDGPDRVAVRELSKCIVSMAEGLPPLYRDALVLAELEGLKQAEIADRLGLSLSGAKSRVQRGRRMLGERLMECCRVELDAAGRVQDYHGQGACTQCD